MESVRSAKGVSTVTQEKPRSPRDAGVVSTANSPFANLKPVPIRAVEMRPGFWKSRMDANRHRSVPKLFDLLEEHGVLDNLRRISGRKSVERRGKFWTDSDLAKWMEAAAFVLQSEDDPRVAEMLDSAIDDLVAIQRADGYIHSFFTGELADQRFRNLAHEHELYCAGHLFQAAIAHYRATGDSKFLDAAVRYADFLTTVFGPGKIEIADGHPEIEMALVELYRTTGNAKYLDLAGFFLGVQGFAEKESIEGHAVRAGYLACGGADYFAETGDERIKGALERLWSDMVEAKMYVTGGVGSRYEGESFGRPYELPNERAYTETCAAIASAMWSWRMLAMQGECRFADVMERALYNGFLSGVSIEGGEYFYMNPLACYWDYQRQPWFGCTCCPTNVVRMVASVPGYIYGTSDEGIWVHLYENSKLDWRLENGVRFTLEQTTKYPWAGDVEIVISPEKPCEFALFLRIPGWCGRASVKVGDEAFGGAVPGEYLKIERLWQKGDVVRLEMEMPVTLMEADPRVREDAGSVAVQRGPIVYCMESTDNHGVPIRDAELMIGEELTADFEPHLLGGVTVVRARGVYAKEDEARGPLYRSAGSIRLDVQETDLRLIPYFTWANRGPSHMKVWTPARG